MTKMLLETGQRERSNHLHKIIVEAPVLPDSDADCVFLHILESEGARTPECVKKRSLCIEKSKCTHGSRCKIHKLKGLKEPLVFLCTYADCADYIFCVFQASPIIASCKSKLQQLVRDRHLIFRRYLSSRLVHY